MKYDNLNFGILNGGKSKRMGYPKSLLIYQNKPLIEYIFNKAFQFTNNVFIIGDSSITENINKNLIINDLDFPGPLAGIAGAYNYKKDNWFFWAIDMPLITDQMLIEILKLTNNFKKSVIPFNNEIKKFEPFFAFYSNSLLNKIFNLINKNKNFYSMQKILSYFKIKGNKKFFNKYKDNFKSWNYKNDIIIDN